MVPDGIDRALEAARQYVSRVGREKLTRMGGSVVPDDMYGKYVRGLVSVDEIKQDGRRYPWQAQFINLGADHPERAMLAANRIGKTDTAAFEVSVHLTGLYPSWWKGHRFKKPIESWCAGVTNESSRDIQQKALVGGIDQDRQCLGTGWIPGRLIEPDPRFRQCGVGDVLDTVRVKHVSGGTSVLAFKAYEQKRAKFQGTSKDLIWLDEEPDYDIYTECVTRIVDCNGILIFTVTPLLGMSGVVNHFMDETKPGVCYRTYGLDDAPHMTQAEKDRFLASVPDYEREARGKGVPMLGSGVVYAVNESDIVCEPFGIKPWHQRVCGIDFGSDHPTAVVWLVHDTDTDVLYVTDCYKQRRESVTYHAEAIRRRGPWIPVSWPHDGYARDRSGGPAIKDQYIDHGVNMLHESARFDDSAKGGGSAQAVEPGIEMIYDRMMTGRFKVFSNLNDWLKERRMYHRKDGLIVKVNDDLMDATRYAVMMLRYAQTKTTPVRQPVAQAGGYVPGDGPPGQDDDGYGYHGT